MSLPRTALTSTPCKLHISPTFFQLKRNAHVVLPNNNNTSDPHVTHRTPSPAATTVNRLLNSFAKTDFPPSNQLSQTEKDSEGLDPELSIVGSGTSSAVLVRLPVTGGARILAARGTVIGKSPSVVSKLSVEENVLAAARGRVVIFEELSCSKDANNGDGDVLLAPKRPWDAVATLKLDGRNELQLRAGALLARSGRVVLLGSGGNTSGLNILSRIFSYKITGRGTVAITAPGGLHKVVLGNDEEYMVDSRRMVAWDVHTSKPPTLSRVQPLEFKAANKNEETKSNPASTDEKKNLTETRPEATASSVSPRVEAIRETASRFARVVWAMGSKWTRELLLGRGDYVKLSGPGVAYLAGRRGITGLERFGVGMDWVARNIPSLPTKPTETASQASSGTPTVKPIQPATPTTESSSPSGSGTPIVKTTQPATPSPEATAGKAIDHGTQLSNKAVLGPAINKKSKRE